MKISSKRKRVAASGQYVIVGAGLDTFAPRQPQLASRLVVFEIDRPGPQQWKRCRLGELGFAIPPFLRFVPVDFERHSWWERLTAAGFDPVTRAVVASSGVSMCLTRDAIRATLRQVAALASGSTLAMSFMLPSEMAEPELRPAIEGDRQRARDATPFLSFFTPDEMLAPAREAGFSDARHVSATALAERYFSRPPRRPPRRRAPRSCRW